MAEIDMSEIIATVDDVNYTEHHIRWMYDALLKLVAIDWIHDRNDEHFKESFDKVVSLANTVLSDIDGFVVDLNP